MGALAVTSLIANFPGVDPVCGTELLDKMREQALAYGTEYRRGQVFLVEMDPERKRVYTPEATYHARALVLATGAMGRPPSYEGEGELLGKGVSYCATCDGAFYCGSEIAVVGANSEAVDEAELLVEFASIVHWITPTDPKPEDVRAAALLSRDNVVHWSRTQVERIEGDDAAGVTGVVLRPRKGGGEEHRLAVEGVFIYGPGSKPITDFLQSNEVVLRPDGGVRVNDDMETNVAGVFAVGDICNKPYKQAVVAAADGCIAAMSIDRYLKGRRDIRVDWVHR